MEIYILDSLWRRTQVVDRFKSLIWTERWKDVGDFELTVKSTLANRALFTPQTKLAMNNSLRVMEIEEVEDTKSSDGEELLVVTGLSLESILQHRVAWHDLASSSPWYITTSPIGLPRELFDAICTTTPFTGGPLLDPKDELPFVTQRYPTPEVPPESEEMVDWVQERPRILLDVIKEWCDSYKLGFRLLREDDSSNLYFEIYSGRDRTTRQTLADPVIFSLDLESIKDTRELASTRNYKNLAYVVADGQTGFPIAPDDGDPNVFGFDRRIELVEAQVPSGYGSPVPLMSREAKQVLSTKRAVSIFDGEVNQYSPYRYGVDYELGDLVEMRNRDGVVSYKHVTEQIFVDDAQGERSYPTLSIGRFESPNTWLSSAMSELEWGDFDGGYIGPDHWTDM